MLTLSLLYIDSDVVAYFWLFMWIWDYCSKTLESVLHIQVFNFNILIFTMTCVRY